MSEVEYFNASDTGDYCGEAWVVRASDYEALRQQIEQAQARVAELSEALQVAVDTPELQGGTWYDMAVSALAERAGVDQRSSLTHY